MTPVQNKLYQYLLERIDNPISPTFAEIAVHMGHGSKSTVSRVIDDLIDQGLVEKRVGKARSLRALRISTLDGVTTQAMIAELKRRGVTKL